MVGMKKSTLVLSALATGVTGCSAFSRHSKGQTRRQLKGSSKSKRSKTIEFAQPDATIFIEPNGATYDSSKNETFKDTVGLIAILDKTIYDTHDRTTVVGRMVGTCTRVEVGVRWFCSGSYEFLNAAQTYTTMDTISVSGPYYGGIDIVIWNTVDGGSGKYTGANGQARYITRTGGWNDVTLFLH